MTTDTIDHRTLSKLAEAGEVAVMKKAHEAAAYVAWLKAEVQEAIDDTSPMLSHDGVKRNVRAAIRDGRAKRARA